MHIILLLFVLCFSSFAQPTIIDNLLRGKEYKMPLLDSSYRSHSNQLAVAGADLKGNKSVAKGNKFTVQLAAMADFDAAQQLRNDLQKRTALGIQIVFDSPFYKLRTGSFTTKDEANVLVRKLTETGVSALIINLE